MLRDLCVLTAESRAQLPSGPGITQTGGAHRRAGQHEPVGRKSVSCTLKKSVLGSPIGTM